MRHTLYLLILLLLLPLSATAQTVALNSAGRDTSYVNTIIARATKNISSLNLHGEKAENVRNIVANRYFELNDIYAERDQRIKFAKDSLTGSQKNETIETARAKCDSRLYRSHFALEAQLSIYVSDKDIVAIKDAMTYNKVKVTYDAYLDEIPSLKEDEKAQIYAWMVEAREIAIDAEGSKQKHEAFNKYKGRVNNYLSKRGYDLNKEREAWFKRLKEREKAKEKK